MRARPITAAAAALALLLGCVGASAASTGAGRESAGVVTVESHPEWLMTSRKAWLHATADAYRHRSRSYRDAHTVGAYRKQHPLSRYRRKHAWDRSGNPVGKLVLPTATYVNATCRVTDDPVYKYAITFHWTLSGGSYADYVDMPRNRGGAESQTAPDSWNYRLKDPIHVGYGGVVAAHGETTRWNVLEKTNWFDEETLLMERDSMDNYPWSATWANRDPSSVPSVLLSAPGYFVSEKQPWPKTTRMQLLPTDLMQPIRLTGCAWPTGHGVPDGYPDPDLGL